MSRRKVRFTQADVARCIRAAQQCGASQVLILPDGTIEIKLQPDEPSIHDVSTIDRSKPQRRFGERLGNYHQQHQSPENLEAGPLAAALRRWERGEITLDQLPPGR
jgi:hypothetical protein